MAQTRRLAAIMFTDMVGYTALGQRDESLSLALVEEQRKLIRSLLDRHNGREVKTIGDAFLIEFPSALDAARCAYGIQRAIREYNVQLSDERKLHLRVGIHLGDVVESGGDISGDAVNVASRIQPMAEDGGVCITRQVYDHVHNKLEIPLSNIGSRVLKNVSSPVELYKMVMPWEEQGLSKSAAVSPKFDRKRIAILPFSSLSPDSKDEYFADGLTEELISTISKVSGIRVVSRTSVIGYKNGTKKLSEIAGELSVGSLIEGSVRKAGNRIRVTVQLIDANTDEHLWSNSYDRELDDIFAIQSEISEQVARALRVRLRESERDRVSRGKTTNMSAYQNYLLGKQLLLKESEESTKRAISLFELAVRLDPQFAEAYDGLARAYELLGHHSHIPWNNSYEISKRMVEKALEIDGDLAEAHATLGFLFLVHEWNLTEAEKEFKRAIDLDPSNASAHRRYARCFAAQGKLDDAVAEAETALELDPLNQLNYSECGLMYWLNGRDKEAFEVWDREKELFSDSDYVYFFPSLALLRDGKQAEAELELSHLSQRFLEEPLGIFLRGMLFANQGRREEALAAAQKLQKLVESGHSCCDLLAAVYAGLGDADEFFRWAREAVRLKNWELYVLKNHDRFLPKLSSDDRWPALLAEAGLS